MRKILIAMLLVLATAFACNATVEDVMIGSTTDCFVVDDIYTGEEFYVCGDVYLNGELLAAGTIVGSESTLGEYSSMIVDGKFAVPITANVNAHQYYYFDLSLKAPCEKGFEEVPVEIKTECVMVPPSTIEAVPNVIEQGEQFTLEVKNAPTDVWMEITGLSSSITTLLKKGDSWSQSLSSEKCSPLGSCVIQFKFTDTAHEICKANADVIMTVKAPPVINENEEQTDEIPLALATLFVLVIGTVGAVILNRYI